MQVCRISCQTRNLLINVILYLLLGSAATAEAAPQGPSRETLSPGIMAATPDSSRIQPLQKPTVRTPASATRPRAVTPVLYFSGTARIPQPPETTPDIDIAARMMLRANPGPLIGPLQESRIFDIFKNPPANQTSWSAYSPPPSHSLLEERPFVAMSFFQQRPESESLRMNQVTHEALHGGN